MWDGLRFRKPGLRGSGFTSGRCGPQMELAQIQEKFFDPLLAAFLALQTVKQ